MTALTQAVMGHDGEMDDDYEHYYRSFPTKNSPEGGYYYAQYKSCNTPSQRYCDICRHGFLTSKKKQRHDCDVRLRKVPNGRYKCRTCLYESQYENKIKKHSMLCKKGVNAREIGLEYEIMTLENTPHTRICPLCFKGFKTFTAREQHILFCKKNKDRRTKHETPIIFCRRCGKSFLMKVAASRHFKLCRDKEIRGGGPSSKKKGKKIKGAQMGVTQKTINFDTIDLNVREIADMIYENSQDIVAAKLKKNDVKIWNIFEFFVVKNDGKDDEEIFPVYFPSSAEQIFIDDYTSTVKSWAEFALSSLDEWLERGSNAKFLKFTKMDMFIGEYKSDVGRGKTGERLPSSFFKKGRILNLINEPARSDYESCFHTCICAYDEIKQGKVDIEKRKTTRETRTHIGKVLDYNELDTTRFDSVRNISSPFEFKNVKKMSKELKPLSYNIFKLIKARFDEKSLIGFHLIPSYLGKKVENKANEDIINLLYYDGHFYLILDLDNLVQYVKGKRNCYGKLCFNCLNSFDTRHGSFDMHQITCSKGLKSNIVYCEPGTIQEFKRWSMLLPAFAYIVCDFESSLIPLTEKHAIPSAFYKKGRVLNITNFPRSYRFDAHLHACLCAFHDIKSGRVDIKKKKTTMRKIGKVVDYEELETSNFSNLEKIPPSISSTNLEEISKKVDIPFTILELIKNVDNEGSSPFSLRHVSSGRIGPETSESDTVKLLYYSNQFYLILDFDALVEYVEVHKSVEQSEKKTQAKANHQINSACAILCLDKTLSDFPYEILKEKEYYIDCVKDDTEEECENLILRFIKHLNSIADIITAWLNKIDVEKQKRELKKVHYEEFLKESVCIYCKEPLTYLKPGVFDHSHTHNRYNGAACSQCNFMASKQRNISCFFHNAPYDCNLLLEHLNFSKLDEEAWGASMIGQKLKLINANRLEIRDSYALLPEKLSDLATSLTEDTSHFQNKYLPYSDNNLKGLYPYTWCTSVRKLDEVEFPSYEHFRNDLGGEICTMDEYKDAKSFYDLNFGTMMEYHLYYLTKDTAILADVLEYHRDLLFGITDMDLLRANSLPDLSYQALFYKMRLRKEVISNHEIYSAWEDANKGGINIVGQRYTEVADPVSERVEYYDLKSSYAHSMTRSLPFSDHEYVDGIETAEQLESFVHQLDLSCEGVLVNIDCYTPIELHDFLSGVPPVCEKKIFSPCMYPTEYGAYRQAQKIPKLINHLGNAKGYYCIAEELILMLQLGIKVTKVNFVIQYKSRPFAKEYVELVSRLRAEELQRLKTMKEKGYRTNKSLSKILKFLLNCVYGKFFLKKINYDEVCIVFDRESHEKKMKSFRFKSSSFNKYSMITKMAQRRVIKDGSPECATTITALGRVNLLNVYYNVLVKAFMKPRHLTPNPMVKVLYIDTDCLCLYIRIHEQDYNHLMKTVLAEHFDFSNLPEDHILFDSTRMGEIGILKYETDGRVIKQFVALCGKCYTISFFDEGCNTCKCKGIPTKISKNFTIDDYLDGLLYPNIAVSGIKVSQRAKYRYIGVNPHLRETYTFEVKKLVLNSLDSKRYLVNNGLDSIPLGHYKTMPGERLRHRGVINNITDICESERTTPSDR